MRRESAAIMNRTRWSRDARRSAPQAVRPFESMRAAGKIAGAF